MVSDVVHGNHEVAVLGGGLAGAYCAHLVAKAGIPVTLYDMGRSGFGNFQLPQGACGFFSFVLALQSGFECSQGNLNTFLLRCSDLHFFRWPS